MSTFVIIYIIAAFVASTLAQECTVQVDVSVYRNGTGLSKDDIKSHFEGSSTFGDPSNTHWSCVDGRATSPIFGTPAGDSGEFLLALTIYQNHGGNVSSDEDVLQIFQDYMATLSASRSFYMHTDTHAFENLTEAIKEIYPEFNNITDIPEAYQPQVFSMVTEPSKIGCGHIRLTLLHPDQYMTPSNLTASFIRAFFNYMWNHENWDKVKLLNEEYETVPGDHTERAVVNIVPLVPNSGPCANKYPLVIPHTSVNSVYVNYPTLVTHVRDNLSTFFSNRLTGVSANTFHSEMDTLGATALTATLSYLAAGMPVYTVQLTVIPTPSTTGVSAASSLQLTIWQYALIIVALTFFL